MGVNYDPEKRGIDDPLVEAYGHAVYGENYGADFVLELKRETPANKFTMLTGRAQTKGYHLYLMLDEYDNFTNTMLRAEANGEYRGITNGQGFYCEWFKAFKGNFDRIYMTGISPMTMDDLTSGFNIAANISQKPQFNTMLGFSEAEVLKIYTDFKGVGRYTDGEPADWVKSIKPWYDGYCFSKTKIGTECVFNSDMVLYHLSSLVDSGTTPVRGGIQGEIRIQGYMQCEFGHLNFYVARPEMELPCGFCDFALFPERCHYGDVQDSYLIELKFSAKDASREELAAKYQEALDQLAKYRADKSVPTLARGTTLHQIVFQFKGSELVRLEQIAEEQMP